MESTCRKSWAANLQMWSDLTLGPLLQSQIRIAKLKSAYNLLIIEKCCLSLKLCQLAFSGGYILHLATDASLV